MNYPLTTEQQLQIKVEQSRRLHDLLAGYDADLRELEANAAAYTVSDYNRRFQAIALLRKQTKKRDRGFDVMTTTRAALLRDISHAIIASGYAVPLKRPHVRRGAQIAELARDSRLGCQPHSAGNVALIDDTMRRYNVSQVNARKMIGRARKMREETVSNGRV